MAYYDCGNRFTNKEEWDKWIETNYARYGDSFLEMRKRYQEEENKERLRDEDAELRARYGDAFDNLTLEGK